MDVSLSNQCSFLSPSPLLSLQKEKQKVTGMICQESHLYKHTGSLPCFVFLPSINKKRVTVSVQCMAGSETVASSAMQTVKLSLRNGKMLASPATSWAYDQE